MKLQRWEATSQAIREQFEKLKHEHPERFERRIDFSYCCQTFGWEPVPKSIERLSKLGYKYIELPGQYGGPDIGPQIHMEEILEAMDKFGVKCSGVSMFAQDGFGLNDKNYFNRQRAVDYIKNITKFCHDCGGQYLLFTPAACNTQRQDAGDEMRSAQTMHDIGDIFTEYGIKACIEPVQPSAMPIVNNFAEAKKYLEVVDHPGVRHIYGDLDHIIHTEDHIAQPLIDYGDMLLNLHFRDTNMGMPIGHGMMDIDSVIRALYIIGFNSEGHFACAEPATRGRMFFEVAEDLKVMRAQDSIEYFREREEEVLNG